jgi:hypothetical protein
MCDSVCVTILLLLPLLCSPLSLLIDHNLLVPGVYWCEWSDSSTQAAVSSGVTPIRFEVERHSQHQS